MNTRKIILIACAVLLGVGFALAPLGISNVAHADTINSYILFADGGVFEENGMSIYNGGFSTGTVLYSSTLPIPIRDGYVFTGWYLAPEYGGTQVVFPYTVQHTFSWHARWVPIDTTFIYNLFANGGTFGDSITEKYGAFPVGYTVYSSDFLTPTRTGYYFAGWYTEAINGVRINFPYTVYDDFAWYAHWSLIPEQPVIHTVTFFRGGVDLFPITQEIYHNNKPIFPDMTNFLNLGDRQFLGFRILGGDGTLYIDEHSLPYIQDDTIFIASFRFITSPQPDLTDVAVTFGAWLTSIFNSLSSFSRIEVFPNITLGILVGFPIILMAIVIVFRLFK